MTLTLPNIEDSPSFDGQAVPDKTDWAAAVAATGQTGVVTGCGVTAQGSPNMTVAVAAGTIVVGNSQVAVSAAASVAIAAASATDRKDIVVVNNAGTVSVVQGTACGTAGWVRTSVGLPPVKPSIPASSVLLAEVYVAASTTSITSANIVDKTTPVSVSPWNLTILNAATYTAKVGDLVIVENAGGVTVTLPASPAVGQVVGVYSQSGFQVIVAPNSGQTLDGGGQKAISPVVAGGGVTVVAISTTAWLTIAGFGQDLAEGWWFNGGVNFAGYVRHAQKAITSGTTAGVQADRFILANAAGGNVTYTLPVPTANPGKQITVKKTDSSGNTVTIARNGAENIEGLAANLVLTVQNQAATLITDGTNWWVTSQVATTIL